MRSHLKLLVASFVGFLVGAAIALLLAMSASRHWVSLSYVFLAEELRLDSGEAASAADWRGARADVVAIQKVSGREGAPWYWYFPLVAWVGADYTMGPSGPHRVEDEAVAAYLASKVGDVDQANASYSALVRAHPGSDEDHWRRFAANKLDVYKFQADGIRRGHVARAESQGRADPGPVKGGDHR